MRYARDKTYQSLARGAYLTALRALEREPIAAETPWSANLRLWARNAVDPWGSAWPLSRAGAAFAITGKLEEPAEAIAAALLTHRVVVLMEAHRAPETRYFGARVLRDLRAAGATHLAFEAPSQRSLDRFIRTGSVRPDTEPYAFDPSRACLLRAAHALELELIAFDYPAEGYVRAALRRLARQAPDDAAALNRKREHDMAANIVHRILRPDPTARVVVWTGEQHAMKRTPPHWPWQHPFMAAHLAALTGDEPFCVWQMCVDMPALTGGPRLVRPPHPRLAEMGVDAIVLHHRGARPARPSWMDVELCTVQVPTKGAELIQAIPRDEGTRAVPFAQQLSHGAHDLSLHLSAGAYWLRGLSGEDESRWQRALDM